MGEPILIHLSKPGGHREGPYTLEQINRDLAAHKYQDTDYWAWHEGMPEWVPLYNLPGVVPNGVAGPPVPASPPPEPMAVPAQPQAPSPASSPLAFPPIGAAAAPQAPAAPLELRILSADDDVVQVSAPPAAPEPKPDEQPSPAHPELPSGMPFAALEHIFLFTTGDGPTTSRSPEVARMLEAIVGTEPSTVRVNVPREVVARCNVDELLKPDGSVSDAVWRAMSAHQPELVKQARERLYRICVRTFRIEAETVVALILFYNKQKL